MATRNDRARLRQQVVNRWFQRFVDKDLYESEDYHLFCKRIKGSSELEIERIYRSECRGVGRNPL